MKAKIYNIRGWVSELEPEMLKKGYEKALKMSGFTILNFQEHFFKPIGWSGLWLLSESHFAIHTFPEENKSYIELSSCTELFFDCFILTLEGFIEENGRNLSKINQK